MKRLLFLLLTIPLFCSCSDDSDDGNKTSFNATEIIPIAQPTLIGEGKFGYYMCHVAKVNKKDAGASYTWYINDVAQNGVNVDSCGFYCMQPDTECKIGVDITKNGKVKRLTTTVKLVNIMFATAGTSPEDLIKNETMYSAMKYHRVPEMTFKNLSYGDVEYHFKYKEENRCHEYTTTKNCNGGVQYTYMNTYHKN